MSNIKSFLGQGLTFHANLFKLTGSKATKKQLEFLEDAMSMLQDEHLPVAKEVPQLKLPQLKSMKDLDKKPSPRRVDVLKEESRLSQQDLQYNWSNKKYRK